MERENEVNIEVVKLRVPFPTSQACVLLHGKENVKVERSESRGRTKTKTRDPFHVSAADPLPQTGGDCCRGRFVAQRAFAKTKINESETLKPAAAKHTRDPARRGLIRVAVCACE